MDSHHLWGFLVFTGFLVQVDAFEAQSFTVVPGENLTVDCLFLNIKRLKPPDGCITNKCDCYVYREPQKYLCRDQCEVVVLNTFHTPIMKGNYSLSVQYYQTGADCMATLKVTMSWLKTSDYGHYQCGLVTPSGYHAYTWFHITGRHVGAPSYHGLPSYHQPFPRPYPHDPGYVPGHAPFPGPPPRPGSVNHIKSRSGCDGVCKGSLISGLKAPPMTVVRTSEGQNITVECPIEPGLLVTPPASCMLPTEDVACMSYFHPELTLHREDRLWPVLTASMSSTQMDRFTVKFTKRAVNITISQVNKEDAGHYVCSIQAPSGAITNSIAHIIINEEVFDLTHLLLLLLVLMVTILVLLLLIRCCWYCWRRRSSKHQDQEEDTTISLDSFSTSSSSVMVMYENDPRPHRYQGLCPSTRDPNRAYYTLRR